MPIDPTAPAAGFDPEALAAAIALAEAAETPWPRDIRAHIEAGFFEPAPDNEILGPVAPRGGPNGLILRHGTRVAAWGDTRQIDMTFSVAKSYLGLLTGLAVQDGLIRDIDEPVGASVRDGGFDSAQNAPITWRHFLQQTSEWEGTLFGKADMIDRNRTLSSEGQNRAKGQARPLKAPGTHWEYNDVRVNRLSLALLRRFARPLPEVFAERIMDPIGASRDWRWHGYRTSTVEVGGRIIESVSGGGHWGGGVFIHAEDQARVGQLMLGRGAWGGRQLIDAGWIAQSLTPCALNPNYGFLWWLNTGHGQYRGAPETSFFAKGAGGNITWVEPEAGIVAVMRWMHPDRTDGFITAVMRALRG